MKVFSIDIPLYRSLILENISYTGYFLNSAEVSCTSTARTVGKKSAHASKSTPSGGKRIEIKIVRIDIMVLFS